MKRQQLLAMLEVATLLIGFMFSSSLALADVEADRENLLADLETSQKAEVGALKAERKEQTVVVSEHKQKIRKLEPKLAMARTPTQANTIRRAAAKLQAVREKAEKRIEEIDETLERLPREHEQARLRIFLKHPLPGDPKYVEEEGVVYSPEDFAALTQLRRQNGDPETVADRYVERLIADGVLEQATRTRSRPYQLTNGPPQKDKTMVFYRCRYTSKGGFVNDREGHVVVDLDRRGFWRVSAITQLNGMEF